MREGLRLYFYKVDGFPSKLKIPPSWFQVGLMLVHHSGQCHNALINRNTVLIVLNHFDRIIIFVHILSLKTLLDPSFKEKVSVPTEDSLME